MKNKLALFAIGLAMLPGVVWAAPCSRINLTKCLDSACAINLSANPAARCQYCGTADAGAPAASAMKSVTAGTASKNSVSAKELKNAPTDPGERYMWATKLCLTKIQNCTTEDVEEAYDPLIEKSCTAAGVSKTMAGLQNKNANNKKTESSCTNDIQLCITADTKCGGDFSNCKQDEDFDKFFATCSAQITGCSNFTAKARSTITSTRTAMLNTSKSNFNSVVASHIKARINAIVSVNQGCKNNEMYQRCIETVCKENTANNCDSTNETINKQEKQIAVALCEFHKTACTKVKNLSEKEMQKDLDKLMDEARNELQL